MNLLSILDPTIEDAQNSALAAMMELIKEWHQVLETFPEGETPHIHHDHCREANQKAFDIVMAFESRFSRILPW